MVREHFRAQPLKKMIWPDTSGNPDTHSALAVIPLPPYCEYVGVLALVCVSLHLLLYCIFIYFFISIFLYLFLDQLLFIFSTGFDNRPKRKYHPTYIKYGFIAIERGGEALPQCVVCMKSLCNEAMKPSLLRRHLETNPRGQEGPRSELLPATWREREAAAPGQDWPVLPEGGRDCQSIL